MQKKWKSATGDFVAVFSLTKVMQMVATSNWFRQHLVPVGLTTAHVILLAISGALHSPTENEAQHLVAGLHHLHTKTFGLYRVNPPLIKTVAAIPVALTGYTSDWSGYQDAGLRPEYDMGEDFIRKNGSASFQKITIARWVCIPFSVVGAWVCFLWARDLFGKYSGYMACCLWCFSPTVIGNASLITPDAHATALGLAACYTFWRWLKQPTWMQAIVTGGVLGLAELSKTTLVLFYPLWPVIWLIYRLPDRRMMTGQQWLREASMLMLRMGIGIYILNLGYLFEGSFSKLGDFQFVSQMFNGNDSGVGNRFRDSWLGEVPVPFPANYLSGIDVQQLDFENFSRPSYLQGKYQAKGWWYYYAYAIIVKSPAGTLGLVMLTLVMQLRPSMVRVQVRDTMVLLTPAVVIFVVVSMKWGFSHHSRYVLPCVPFAFIWIGQLAPSIRRAFEILRTNFQLTSSRTGSVLLGVLTVILFSWSIVSSVINFPHSLSYFNELSGGSANGPKHLIASNIDWGQDLLFLDDWIKDCAHQTPVYLAFYNSHNPFDLGIQGATPWPFEAEEKAATLHVPEGYYAISVNLLYEYPWHVRDTGTRRYRIDNRPLAYLRSSEPIGWAGYSIRIFSADQLCAAYKAPELRLLPDP